MSMILAALFGHSTWAAVTGPDIFETGVWVRLPGITVGKLFAGDSRMITLVGDGNGFLHAWYPDGTHIPGFPKLLNDHSRALSEGGVIQDYNSFIDSTPSMSPTAGELKMLKSDGF